MNEIVVRLLEVAAICVGFLILIAVLYCCFLEWLTTRPVPMDLPQFPLQEQPQGRGGNGNGAGQQVAGPEQQAAQDSNGNGARHHQQVADPEQLAAQDGDGIQEIQQVDPQQEADLGDGEGGGGDQQEDDGGHHHQHLPVLLPDSDMLPGSSNQAPRTAKVKPIQDGTLPPVDELKEDYAVSGKLNAKSALYSLSVVLLKLLPRKKPSEQQGVSSEPFIIKTSPSGQQSLASEPVLR